MTAEAKNIANGKNHLNMLMQAYNFNKNKITRLIYLLLLKSLFTKLLK